MEGYTPPSNGACRTISKNSTSGYVRYFPLKRSTYNTILIPEQRTHKPFMYFRNIKNSTAGCKNTVNAQHTFASDVTKGASAPQYMYYVPNLANNIHDTNVTYAVTDLRYIIDTMLNNKAPMKSALTVITFDENGMSCAPVAAILYSHTTDEAADIYSPQFSGTPKDVYTVLLGNVTGKCYDCVRPAVLQP